MDRSGTPQAPGGAEKDPLQKEIETVLYRRNGAIMRAASLSLLMQGVIGEERDEQLRQVHKEYVDLMVVDGLSIRAATARILSRERGKALRRSLVVFCAFATLLLAAGQIVVALG
jgi:hypothetical protein